MRISAVSFEPRCEKHFLIPISFRFVSASNSLFVATTAMLDSGASSCFIDSSFASSHNFPFVTKKSPVPVQVIDGQPISSGPITSHTAIVKMTIEGTNHSEDISFNVISMSYPVVLGIPWLRKHMPSIDWNSGSVTFSSHFCLHNCFPSLHAISNVSNPHHVLPHDLDSLTNKVCASATLPFTKPQKHQQVSSMSTVRRGLPFENWLNEPRSSPPVRSSKIAFVSPYALSKMSKKEGALCGIFMCSVDTSDTISTFELPKEYLDFKMLFDEQAASKLPNHQPWDHHIPLQPGAEPPYGPIYSLSENELEALRTYLEENLEKGFIRASTSPAGAPILFAKKKDGSLRLCVDYRGLNNVTIKNRYALPLISELFDRLRGAKIFTKLDLRGAYNLIRIAEGEEWKTAFRTRYGHFEYLVMPFGLTNAPASFQSLLNHILRHYLDHFVIVYLDDILIFSKNEDEHIEHVRTVLKCLEEHSLYVKGEKCMFHKPQVNFLGFEISEKGVFMDSSKVEVLKAWSEPKDVTSLLSFLGFANYYRRFIKDYSKIAQPLTSLLRKDTTWKWTPECQSSFDSLKKSFTTAPILRHFDPELPCIIECDASDYCYGGVLSQKDASGELRPVAFYSKKMTPPQLNYPIYDKELLAIVECFAEWRVYLEGAKHKITVFTDHKNLEFFTTTKKLNRRQARWSEHLSSFDFVVIYRTGVTNSRADMLSRNPDFAPTSSEANKPAPPLLSPSQFIISAAFASHSIQNSSLNEEIRTAQLRDSFLNSIIQQLQQDKPSTKPNPSFSLCPSTNLLLFEGLVYVPNRPKLKLAILAQLHDSPGAGHFGSDKTFELVSRTYYWPKIRQYITTYCKQCDLCLRSKTLRHKPYGTLRSLPVPVRPWTSISMDFIVKLPPSTELSSGSTFDSVFVVVDRLTKFGYFVPCKETMTAEDFAYLFARTILSNHGLPEEVISDRGSVFLSRFISSLSSMLSIKQAMSTAFHPQTDGQTERLNEFLEQYLRIFVNYEQNNWVSLLPLAQFAYNNSQQSSTKHSPFFANYGYHPRLDISIPSTAANVTSQSAQQTFDHLRLLHATLRTEIKHAQLAQERNYNLRRSPAPTFAVGQKVWLSRKHIRTERPSSKLDHKRLGPFEIIRNINNIAYELRLPPSMKIHPVFHVSLLEPTSTEPLLRQTEPPPPPVAIEGEEEFEVSHIISSKKIRNKTHYLVHWKGYGIEDRTWEPISNLEHCKDLIEQFHSKPKPKTSFVN